jgi:hypothetical protein
MVDRHAKSDQAADSQLGEVMLRCRNRSPAAAGMDLGASVVQFVLGPLAIALVLTVAVVLAMMKLELRPHPILGIAVVVWFVASAAAAYWYFFTASDAATLVLYEHGFRYKNRIVRFADLAVIRPGRVFSPLFANFARGAYMLNKMLSVFSRGNRMAAEYYENCERASLTLEFKDGRRKWSMNRVLVEHPRADVDAFLKTVAQKHPELIATPAQAAEHLAELAC